MANNQICFFYAPTWDYPPSGPIKLGNVIASVKNPQRALHCAPPAGSNVFSTSKDSVQYTKEKMRGGKFSIITKFLSFLGIGADVGVESGRSIEETFSFTILETTQFSPTKPYLQECLEAEEVRRFLEISRYRKPVYVITGLKIVTGAKVEAVKSHTFGGKLAVEVDGTIWSGLPVNGGPGIEGEASSKAINKWSAKDDFIFAFRVVKVVAGKAPGQVLSEEEYRKGAMLESKQEYVGAARVSLLGHQDLDAKAEGFDIEELVEDENLVTCVEPRGESW